MENSEYFDAYFVEIHNIQLSKPIGASGIFFTILREIISRREGLLGGGS